MSKLTKDEVIRQLANMAFWVDLMHGESQWLTVFREAITMLDTIPQDSLSEVKAKQAYISYKEGFEEGARGIYATAEEVAEDARILARQHADTVRRDKWPLDDSGKDGE